MTKTEDPDSIVAITAIRGIQQRREFYTVMLQLRCVPNLCVSRDATCDEDLPLKYRRQRKLSVVRANRLYRYLLQAALTKTDYVLPALTCTIGGPLEFTPSINQFVGILSCPADQPWYLADGQHRTDAIKRLRATFHRGEVERKKLSREQRIRLELMLEEHVPVTIFHEAGDATAQQIFADINRNSSKPPRELIEAFDHRSRPHESGEI